jgi:hypothetical protein
MKTVIELQEELCNLQADLNELQAELQSIPYPDDSDARMEILCTMDAIQKHMYYVEEELYGEDYHNHPSSSYDVSSYAMVVDAEELPF